MHFCVKVNFCLKALDRSEVRLEILAGKRKTFFGSLLTMGMGSEWDTERPFKSVEIWGWGFDFYHLKIIFKKF